MMYSLVFKRAFDLFFSFFGFALLSPIFIFISLILLIVNDGKPFFIQPRPGKNEKIFNLIKFKTMNDKRDSENKLLPDSERLTKIGSFIRRTSLDEIPQIINVIKGDMSLVGPRPLLVEYLPLYNESQKKRHNIKPGITGWAQVNGRNAITWQKKLEYDVWYVQNVSFIIDIKIMIFTLVKVLKSEGINSKNLIPMEKFTGN